MLLIILILALPISHHISCDGFNSYFINSNMSIGLETARNPNFVKDENCNFDIFNQTSLSADKLHIRDSEVFLTQESQDFIPINCDAYAMYHNTIISGDDCYNFTDIPFNKLETNINEGRVDIFVPRQHLARSSRIKEVALTVANGLSIQCYQQGQQLINDTSFHVTVLSIMQNDGELAEGFQPAMLEPYSLIEVQLTQDKSYQIAFINNYGETVTTDSVSHGINQPLQINLTNTEYASGDCPSVKVRGVFQNIRDHTNNEYVPLYNRCGERIEGIGIKLNDDQSNPVTLNEPIGQGFEVVGPRDVQRYQATLYSTDYTPVQPGPFEGLLVYSISYL